MSDALRLSNRRIVASQTLREYFMTQPKSIYTRDLSRRELQCLQISVRGRSARQVATELGISQRTVEEYLNNVKKKLGVTSKSEMINVVINLLLEV